jgi:hypothetical protein
MKRVSLPTQAVVERTNTTAASLARGFVVTLFMAVAVWPSWAAGEWPPAVIVYGTGSPDVDVPAVQAAVDQGGSVHLVGTFDFGDSGRVLLRKDVAIAGEVDASGAPITTIKRGDWTFFTPMPDCPTSAPTFPSCPTTLPPTQPGPKVSVRGIHFTQSRGAPIHLAYSGGADISGNKMTEIRRRPFTTFFRRAGVLIGPRDAAFLPDGRPETRIFPMLVTGAISVTDNIIDVGGSDPTTTSGVGAFVNLTAGADVYVARNLVTGCTRNCLDTIDIALDAAGNGSTVIEDNTLITDVSGIPIPTPGTPNGIVVGFNFNPGLMNDPAWVAPTLISNNYIEVRGQVFQGSTGIVVLARDVVAEGNTVLIDSAIDIGAGMLIRGIDVAILHNRFLGTGGNAIRFDSPTATGFSGAIDGLALGNNVSRFEATHATYLFRPGSTDNTIVGDGGTVIDLGTGNRVTGAAPMEGGVGRDVADEMGDGRFSD